MTAPVRRATHLWPSPEQCLLLEAALLDRDRALAAFRRWREHVSLDDKFSRGSFRLLPLVYHRLQQLGVDDPVMGKLKGVYRRAWYETHRLFQQVQPVVARLAGAGIDVMLTKGAPLALGEYGAPAVRPMADVDVVVPGHRLRETLGELAAAGWRPGIAFTPDEIRYRHAAPWYGPDGGAIDLHWRVMYESSARGGDDTFWDTAVPLDFMGTAVRRPDATHHLFLVVVHGVRRNEETPVRWIPDAMAILRAPGVAIDWQRMEALAAANRATVRLALGLSWLARVFDAPVPPGVLERLGTLRVSWLERLENTVMLADDADEAPSLLRSQWTALSEYARCANGRGPIAFAAGYTDFLRYRMGLGARREILPRMVRSMGRRIARAGGRSARDA
ncbi:MAG TPA: nucleotidyltransferase family protein [Gemmatimonadaceae bacterium]|nr:nucleotidyltransferase family protein [Gemmatimonadaceae bacterium]